MKEDDPVSSSDSEKEKSMHTPNNTQRSSTPTGLSTEEIPSIFDSDSDSTPDLITKSIPIPMKQKMFEENLSPTDDANSFSALTGHSPTFVPKMRYSPPVEDLSPRKGKAPPEEKTECSTTSTSSNQSVNEMVKDSRKPTKAKILHLIELAEGHLKSDDYQRAYQANGLASQMCVNEFSSYLKEIREQRQRIINSEVQKCIDRIENPSKNDGKSEASILRQALGMSKRQRNRRYGQQTKTKIETLKKTKRIEIRHEEMLDEKDLTKMHETLLKNHEETKKAIERLDKEIEELKTQTELYKAQLKNRISEEKTISQMLQQLKKQRTSLMKFHDWLPSILKVKDEYKKIETQLNEKKEEYSKLMKKQEELRNKSFKKMKEDNMKLASTLSEENKLSSHIDNGRKELNDLCTTLKEKKNSTKHNKEMYMLYLNLERQRTLLRLETLKKRLEKRKIIEKENELPPDSPEITKLEKSLNEILKEIDQQEKKLKNGSGLANLQQIKQPPNYSFECVVPL